MYFSTLASLYISANIVNFLPMHFDNNDMKSSKCHVIHFYLLFSFNISIEIIARDLLLQGTHFKGIVSHFRVRVVLNL